MRRASAVKARQRRLKDEAENEEEALADTSVTSSEIKTPKSAGNKKGGRNLKASTGKEKESEDKNEAVDAEFKGLESGEEKSSDLEEKYEVEKIVDMKVVRGVKKYRIRWKGYDSDSDTWETEDNLNCPEIMQEFLTTKVLQSDVSGKKSGKKRASKTATEASEELAGADLQETLINGSSKGEENSASPKDEAEDETTPPKKKKRLSEKAKFSKKQSDTGNVGEYDADDDEDRNKDDGQEEEISSEVTNKKQKVKSKVKSKVQEPSSADSHSENDLKNDETLHEDMTTKKQRRGKTAKNKPVPKKSEELADESEEKTSDEAYEVEKIMEVHHKKNGKKEYLIHWRGYPHSQDTWEPEEHLDCEELIQEFEEKVNKAKDLNVREMRAERARTSRYSEEDGTTGKRQSKRGKGKKRTTYFDAE